MSDEAALQAETARFREEFSAVLDCVHRIIVGQERVVECAVTAIFCGGNVLLEGVPGLGKTELVKTLSRALTLDFNRVQFTPDLMPADIIGTNVMTNDGSGTYRFEFRRGPIFTQLLLADEINRATPKTQSALLEAMQEMSVTAGGTTYQMKRPYFVLATQNPIEQEGTYPLPEAQLDRFIFKVDVPFLNRQDLNEVVSRTILRQAVEISPVLDGARILQLRDVLAKVVVADPVRDYAVRLTLATHPDSPYTSERVKSYVRWGASPRAAQALIRAGRVRALAGDRAHVACEDIRYFSREVFGHRILLNYDGQAEGISVADLVNEITDQIPEEAS
ncbi:MAG: MoxR family ATPase [Planctomycetes bacterium]|nr:MoxR family ATPase [Planctomycetota bacterium]